MPHVHCIICGSTTCTCFDTDREYIEAQEMEKKACNSLYAARQKVDAADHQAKGMDAIERAKLDRLAPITHDGEKKHTLEMRFGDIVRGKLDTMKKLSTRNGIEPTDQNIISRALATYEFLLLHRGLGHTTFVELEDGTQVEIPLE